MSEWVRERKSLSPHLKLQFKVLGANDDGIISWAFFVDLLARPRLHYGVARDFLAFGVGLRAPGPAAAASTRAGGRRDVRVAGPPE